jgi:peptidoglycan L-alanyl-D-glutamate endopeptidase CwlK
LLIIYSQRGALREKEYDVQVVNRVVKVLLVAMLVSVGGGGVMTTASAATGPAAQRAALAQYGLTSQQLGSVVIDSLVSYDEALGDAVVPAEARALHAKIKPYLRVVPVIYHGYDNRLHVGQIVVHRYIVGKVVRLFVKMYRAGFPIQSVIPSAHFGYDDQASMAVNNSSAYRPEDGSEHRTGAAIDLNPFTNPFDVTAYDPTRPIEPAGAHYDPNAQGAIVKSGLVRQAFTAEGFEWGGGWGDPEATPPTDFFRTGYFDYQHFQPDLTWYDWFYLNQLPPGI